jgi:hypothetical protein
MILCNWLSAGNVTHVAWIYNCDISQLVTTTSDGPVYVTEIRRRKFRAREKHHITDAERAASIRKLAREADAGNDPAVLDSALKKIVQHLPEPTKPATANK